MSIFNEKSDAALLEYLEAACITVAEWDQIVKSLKANYGMDVTPWEDDTVLWAGIVAGYHIAELRGIVES